MNLPRDNLGWTVVPTDMPALYVNPSGDNANDGSELKPLLTIARATELAKKRPTPTAILLAAGATFRENIGFGGFKQPVIFGTYKVVGQFVRPRIITPPEQTTINVLGCADVTFLDLEITQELTSRRRSDAVRVVGNNGPTGSFHLEGCDIHNVRYAVNFGGSNGSGVGTATIRRCLIHDTWNEWEKSQGIYGNWTGSLLVEETLLYRCGWLAGQQWLRDGQPAPEIVQENHCCYLAETITQAIIRRNIFARACSHGLQLRCGGSVEENLFYCNPIHGFGANDFHAATRNVFYDSSSLAQGHGVPSFNNTRGWGWQVQSHQARLDDNRFVRGGPGGAIKIEEVNQKFLTRPVSGDPSASILNNLIDWAGPDIQIIKPRNLDNIGNSRIDFENFIHSDEITDSDLDQVLKYWRGSEAFSPVALYDVAWSRYQPNGDGDKIANLQRKVAEQAATLDKIKALLQ